MAVDDVTTHGVPNIQGPSGWQGEGVDEIIDYAPAGGLKVALNVAKDNRGTTEIAVPAVGGAGAVGADRHRETASLVAGNCERLSNSLHSTGGSSKAAEGTSDGLQ